MPVKTVSLTANAVYQRPAYDIPPRVLVITNTDKTNPVYYSTGPGTIDAQSSQIPPGSAETFDGLDDVWMSTLSSAISVLVDYKIGSRNFAPGSLAIVGNVNATVSGNVNVTNTPNVAITGTPNVNVSSGSLTATVNGPVQIEPTAGQPLDVSAATVTVTAAYILPGKIATLVSDLASHSMGPLASFTYNGGTAINVQNYSAINLTIGATSSAQNSVGAAITCPVTLDWFDDSALQNRVYTETVFAYVGATTVAKLSGISPVHGQYLRITVQNTGTISNVSVSNLVVTGSFRSPVYSSWRSFVPLTAGSAPDILVNGFTVSLLNAPAGGQQYSGNLGMLPNVTPGTGLRVYLLPLYAGPVAYYWQVNTAALSNMGTLVDLSFVTSGNLSAGTAQAGVIRGLTNTINTPDSQSIMFPRSPVGLVVNPAATSSMQFSAIGQQGY